MQALPSTSAVQNAAKALMIRHEQRVGLMDRDWHPFEARMAPMLNAIGLHFATEGFTPARRGHARNFLAWGYFQGAITLRTWLKLSGRSCCPFNPEHGFTAAAAAFAREITAARSPSACICAARRLSAAAERGPAGLHAGVLRRRLPHGVPKPAQAELFVFSDDPPMCGSIWTLRACRCITAPGQKVPRRTLP